MTTRISPRARNGQNVPTSRPIPTPPSPRAIAVWKVSLETPSTNVPSLQWARNGSCTNEAAVRSRAPPVGTRSPGLAGSALDTRSCSCPRSRRLPVPQPRRRPPPGGREQISIGRVTLIADRDVEVAIGERFVRYDVTTGTARHHVDRLRVCGHTIDEHRVLGAGLDRELERLLARSRERDRGHRSASSGIGRHHADGHRGTRREPTVGFTDVAHGAGDRRLSPSPNAMPHPARRRHDTTTSGEPFTRRTIGQRARRRSQPGAFASVEGLEHGRQFR